MTILRLHPMVLRIREIHHLVLLYFYLPTTTEHVSAHSASEIADVAITIVPADWRESRASCFVGVLNNSITKVTKKMREIIAIDISIEKLLVTHFTR
jgi:hypothetical protein